MIPIVNSLGLDALSAHWEFAYESSGCNQRLAELNFPVLANSVFDKVTKKAIYQAYAIKEICGLHIGIIGIASKFVDKTMPPSFSEGIYFTLGKAELPTIIDLLHVKEKIDLIVLISHFGFAQDMKLLSEVHLFHMETTR